MAVSQSANVLEKAMGHVEGGVTEQNMTNPDRDRQQYGDPSGERMKALVWNGKNSVEVGSSLPTTMYFNPRPDPGALLQSRPTNPRSSKSAM